MSMAYTLGNKCAKNCCKWTILVHLIVKNVVMGFFETQCRLQQSVQGPIAQR